LVYQQFTLIFFALVEYAEMKFDKQNSHKNVYIKYVLGSIKQFLTELCPLHFEKFQLLAVSWVFFVCFIFAEIPHIKIKFGIENHHENI
jgi:hypothetical protein